MPTKRNRAGNQQNYIEAGHGDASGEYGDNATGSNKHFQSFKKPNDDVGVQIKADGEKSEIISKESKADETPISDEARKIQ